jgi:hypothetical protein
MCNLYAMMKGRAEVAALIRALTDRNNNQPPTPGVFPDYPAPVVVRDETGARELRDMRWGMPSSKKALMDAASKRADKLRAKGGTVDFNELFRMEPDKGTTNIRNTASRHWQPLAWSGQPLPGSVHVVQRARPGRRLAAAGLVRTRGGPPAGVLRRRLDAMGLRAEDQDRLGRLRTLRLPHH